MEGSIANAYLVEKASNFCSYYFEDSVHTKQRCVPQNDMGRDDDLSQKIQISLLSFSMLGEYMERNHIEF